ncbi:glycosyltransferase [Cesiribacter sp. SM1]|uniref:glycosyltransferase n=1 Tax=Cesiribacter sp. SM1 TaxID=2861196 RepID=UPI001CD292FC|nr:glycosyltransferase [Cesiribacter sp. SM1]
MKNILVLTSWSYKDALIQTYTLPYLKIILKKLPEGSRVFLLTQEQESLKMRPDELTAVKKQLMEDGIVLLPFKYIPFGPQAGLAWTKSLLLLKKLVKAEGIDYLHAFCTPAGAIGYMLSLITDKPLVLDSFEPHAEAMVENKTWRPGSISYKVLLLLEKLQYRRASYIVSATEGMRKYAREKYGVAEKKMWVKPACVDLELFTSAKLKQQRLLNELGLQDKLVCVYAGKFGGIYLDQEVFDFFKVAYDYWGDRFRVLLLTNQPRNDIDTWCKRAGVPAEIVLDLFVPHSKVADYMGLGDFALTPVKPVPTKRYCTPIKNGEYWALGLPVVTTANISDDSGIIDQNSIGAVIETLNEEPYLAAVKKIDSLLSQPKEEVFTKIRNIAKRYRSFDIAEHVYQEIYGAKEK